MNKTAIGLSLILVILLTGAMFDDLATANPVWINMNIPKEPFNNPPTIHTFSPAQNQLFRSSNALLKFTIEIPDAWVFSITQYNPPLRLTFGNITSVRYSLDNNEPQNLTVDAISGPHNSNISQNLDYSIPLNLSDGAHTIRIFVSGFTYYVSDPYQYNPPLASVPVQAFAKISFNVALPTPIITSPNRTVYNESAVPLEFISDSPASWIGYSLDGKAKTTITSNTTLTGLTNGSHNITVYTNDTLGNIYSSEPAYFTVAIPEPPPIPVMLIATSIIAVTLVGIGLAVYIRRRKLASKQSFL